MIKFSKEGLDFIKKNPPILFSLILIIFLPLFIFSITSFTIKSFEENVNLALHSKAVSIRNLFSQIIRENLSSLDFLQKKIDETLKENPDIRNLKVIFPSEKERFKIVASSKKNEIGKEISGTSLILSWQENQSFAYIKKENKIRYWDLISPFFNKKNQKAGLIFLTLSLEETDKLILKRIQNTYIFAIIGTLLVLILVLQHTRLFGYVDLARKLQEIDKAKDEFLNMAVHELRSPIVAIRGYLEFLKKPVFSLGSQTKEDFERIQISAKKLNDLIDDMLQVVRLAQERLSFEPKIISPENIIEEEIKEFQPKTKEKNLFLKFEKGEKGFIKVNVNRFREILTNLIENAIKYTKRGGVIVKTEIDRARKKYYIIIEDTGIGISAENQKRLFQKFFRVKSRETVDIPGTGLGLWIVKELIRKMDGEVFVESLEGVGSKFKITFPLIRK